MDKLTSLQRFLRRRTDYDWVHPSWRDLIIDHMATNARARREFLARCTSPGILLALSNAGGARGERAFPLARQKEDWGDIGSAVSRVLRSVDESSVSDVLAGLASAFQTDSVRAGQCPPSPEDVARISKSALETCRTRWDTDPVVLASSTLESYYRLSADHAPFVGSPDLTETWHVRWTEADEELSKNLDDPNIEADGVERWGRLAALLANNEPRFLRFHEFPDLFIAPIESFLERIANFVDCDWGPDTEDDYQSEIAHLHYIGAAVRVLTQALPVIRDKAVKVEEETKRRSDRLEEECYERFQSSEPEYEEESVHPSRSFDIDRFFADL